MTTSAKPRARFNVNRFRRMVGIAHGMISACIRGEWSHEGWLYERKQRIFGDPAWQRMTLCEQQEIRGMLVGAEAVFHAAQLIIWAHWMDGKHISVEEFKAQGGDYAALDTDKSAHVWAKSRKVWFGGGSSNGSRI